MQDMGSGRRNILAAGRVADQQSVYPGSLGAGGGIRKPEAIDPPFTAPRLQEIEFRNVRSEFDAHLVLRDFSLASRGRAEAAHRSRVRCPGRIVGPAEADVAAMRVGRRQWPMTPKTSAAANATETKKVRVSEQIVKGPR